MTLKQLQYVIRIVECNSITAAARDFSVSQPAITKAVSSLEEEYGIKIFDRKSHGVRLTEAGQEFVHYARGVASALESLNVCVEEKATAKRRLSVAAQQLDFLYSLYDSCAALCGTDPSYFNLIESERDNVVWSVLKGYADIGLMVRSREDEKDYLLYREGKRLDVNVVDSGSCSIAVGPGCPLYGRNYVSMEEAVKYPQVALDIEAHAKNAYWLNQRHYAFFDSKQVVFCNTLSAVEHFLLHTGSVSFVSAWTKAGFRDKDIQIIPVENTENDLELLWIKLTSEALTPMESFFLQQLYVTLGKPIPELLMTGTPAESDQTKES